MASDPFTLRLQLLQRSIGLTVEIGSRAQSRSMEISAISVVTNAFAVQIQSMNGKVKKREGAPLSCLQMLDKAGPSVS